MRSNYQLQSGRLLTSLSKHSYSSSITSESYTIFVRILPYLRFLDMAYRQRNDRIAKFKRRNLALYNRVVWGVLAFCYGAGILAYIILWVVAPVSTDY